MYVFRFATNGLGHPVVEKIEWEQVLSQSQVDSWDEDHYFLDEDENPLPIPPIPGVDLSVYGLALDGRWEVEGAEGVLSALSSPGTPAVKDYWGEIITPEVPGSSESLAEVYDLPLLSGITLISYADWYEDASNRIDDMAEFRALTGEPDPPYPPVDPPPHIVPIPTP